MPLQQYQTGLNYSEHFNFSTKSCVELDLDLFEIFSVPERPRDILSNQIFIEPEVHVHKGGGCVC